MATERALTGLSCLGALARWKLHCMDHCRLTLPSDVLT